jgi:hypothetical protein
MLILTKRMPLPGWRLSCSQCAGCFGGMSMTNTEKCRVKAEWRQYGSRLVYRVPCTPTTVTVEHLGAVKERGDGRWNWWRWKSTFHHQWITDQGVALSRVAAELQVLEGWEAYDGLDRIAEFMDHELTPEQAEDLKAQTCGFQLSIAGKQLPPSEPYHPAAHIHEMTREERISHGYVNSKYILGDMIQVRHPESHITRSDV